MRVENATKKSTSGPGQAGSEEHNTTIQNSCVIMNDRTDKEYEE